MNYYNGKTKSSQVPCHLHTDAQGKPLPCNMDECKEVACNYRDWQKNGSVDKWDDIQTRQSSNSDRPEGV